jgi:serine/threonine-protein kinase
MSDTNWYKVREIFDLALRRQPDERRRFLNEVCGDDETLLTEVESLLSSHDSAESFMETPAVARVADVIETNTKKLETGKCFGHYEIINQIGAGGMGEVYLAKDKKLDRNVAVKILNEEFSQDASNLNRFIREAKATSRLNHPNILVVHEIGQQENTNYIVSEFINGKTLREVIKEKRLKLSEVLDISIPIADALCTAHSSNIIHRDIKPENIMVRPDGVVKVLDFGLAKVVQQKDRSNFGLEESTVQLSHTAKDVIMGTVSYMSPEQARAQRVDARTDIFSFGIMLYEMLTGQQPFTGETFSHTIVAILEKEPPPLSQFISSFPPEIERIIKNCLAKKADKRYSMAKSLLDDLKDLKEELAFQSKLERRSASNKKTETETQFIRAAITAKTEKRNSIAVLPFTNISAEAENEYFCDGLAEELLNALAKIDDLKVAARTSAFSFKNKNTEVSQIGKTLNVSTILEGSVRKSGNRIRISLQLINVADGYHLWSERYDREMKEIFDVQDEITLAVVDALKVKLFGEEKAAILKRYTDSPEAYELYLKGLYHCYKWTDEGFRKSIEYFEKALEEDPEFAPAYAKIADYYHFTSHIGLFSPHEIHPKWKAAAQRALEIDEGLADAHLAMAHIYFYFDRDWAKAEGEFERAIELNANSTDAHKYYGLFLASRERFDQAVAEGKKALALDPLSIAVNIVGGFIYLFVDRLDDALGLVRQMIELDSNAPQGYWVGGSLLMANGKYEEAVEAFQKSLSLGDNQMALAKLGCAYGLVGRRDEALKILDQLFEMRKCRYAAPFNIARVYAGLGDNDNAFEWMEKAVEERDADLVFLKRYVEAGAGVYLGASFSTDSRYEDILCRADLRQTKSR